MRAIITDRRLEAAAGEPLAQRTTDGVSPDAGLGAMEGRTLYAVVNLTATTGNYSAYASVGKSDGSGGIYFQTNAAGGTSLSVRVDTRGGSLNETRILAGARTVGKHIMWASVVDGMTSFAFGVDGTTVAWIAPIVPGTGMATSPLTIFAPSDGTAAWAGLYRGFHDEATRKRVIRWLAARYGVQI